MKKALSLLCIPFAVHAQKNLSLKGKLSELAGQVVLLEGHLITYRNLLPSIVKEISRLTQN